MHNFMIEIEGVGEEVVLAALIFVISTTCMGFLVLHVAKPTTQMTSATAQTTTRRRVVDICPICLSDIRLSCETNCGHAYCAPCIVEYLQSRRRGSPCPYCRQHIHLLHTFFTAAEDASREGQAALRRVAAFNCKSASGHRGVSFFQSFSDMPVLLRWAGRPQSRSALVIWLVIWTPLRVAYCLLAILYVLSPIDLLPEAILGMFGMLDDVLLIFLVFVGLASAIREHLLELAASRLQEASRS
ncbi:Aste57867_702 [Aphanomyces stellatus]|uniref:E3 ubiquitin-protein ligase RNF170 n=1 Tax=Aphanomyces stellatus TaxID=120398 RepID=A0A485K8B2_9STRA|nr:hypothetical protein As57867_000701 [Aphanomyces stellatus]VFT77926.1 Aste57867_702 [Aphanomyces stellatus]